MIKFKRESNKIICDVQIDVPTGLNYTYHFEWTATSIDYAGFITGAMQDQMAETLRFPLFG